MDATTKAGASQSEPAADEGIPAGEALELPHPPQDAAS